MAAKVIKKIIICVIHMKKSFLNPKFFLLSSSFLIYCSTFATV